MHTITQSGFHTLEGQKEISIADNLCVFLLDDGSTDRTIHIGTGAQVSLYGLYNNEMKRNITCLQESQHSSLEIRYILISRDEQKIDAKIFSDIRASHTKSDVKILSLASEKGYIILDGSIQIGKGIEKVDAHLLEENIFLGSSGKISGIPTLLVGSDDVSAGHACRMERISDEKLFYLRSRGIEKDHAVKAMIGGYLNDMLVGLKQQEKTVAENIINKVFQLV
ncbi:SufD family Fe-S cluster assembly protein [Candidatus Gracilibacteria bacterium]|nr:SufD family Fe-S cluster assembly protein [Candidatus Gracilibacteria bacterium]